MAVGMQTHTEIDPARAVERREELRTTHMPNYRQQLTRVVMREVLRRTISRPFTRRLFDPRLAEVKQNLRNLVPNQ